MAGKNKKNKKRRTDDYNTNNDSIHKENGYHDEQLEEDTYETIPNGFTINFDVDDNNDGFDDRRSRRRNGNNAGGRRAGHRSKNEEDEDDDEVDSEQQAPRGGHGSQVLPVATSLPDDHTGIPEDGHEYLFLVRREAATHPGVITAQAFVGRDDITTESSSTMASTSTSSATQHRPSTEWRTAFLSRFSNMRQVMATSSSQPSEASIPPHYLPIPSAQDESSWRTYINGRKGKGKAREVTQSTHTHKENEDNAMGGQKEVKEDEMLVNENAPLSAHEAVALVIPAVSEQTALDSPASAEEPSQSASSSSRPPIPILMRNLDHYTTISLLDHFNSWLSERFESISEAAKPSTIFVPNSMARRKKKVDTPKTVASTKIAGTSSATAIASATPPPPSNSAVIPIIPTTPLILTALDSQWIFSLLTVLDPLLSSSEISILRTLAKTCQNIADFTYATKTKWTIKGADQESTNGYSESIAGCWMINAAIWEIWGQRDLWES